MDALGAARMGDEIAHGAGILGMLAGAVVGAVVAVAVVAAVAATGGLAIVIFAGAIAGGALAANQILKGLKTIFELPDPTTGVLASGSHNVFTNDMPAARATLDFASSCSGGSFPFITHPYWPYPVAIAEGAKKVTINSMPAARITMLMTCSAFIKTASDNVFIGGPTARTEFVWDWTGWLETGFTWLGIGALVGAGVLAAMAGVAALAGFVAVTGVAMLAFEGLGQLGDMIGPGYRDLFQGIAGMGLLLAGPKMAKLQVERQTVAKASQWQGKGDYPGVDNWRLGNLKKGDIVYGGVPGQSEFYLSKSSFEAAGGSKVRLWESAQVKAHDTYGYRGKVQAYEVTNDVGVATSTVEANPHLGGGGATQFYVENFGSVLKPVGDPIVLR